MSALTMTLLPEPVAPAISRCGILDRSTAWARPATSRPSANVSVDPDAEKSTSSRIRRSATMLNSLFGISIPTALLPGIGASIRMLRAASAIDRSSWSASIRLSLMCGAGWTSYWVTTGPALRPMIRASMSKLASFRTMISSFRAWTRSALSVVAAVGTSPGSSRSWGGRRHSMASRVGGESEASVTSSGPRETGSTGSPTAVLDAASAPPAAPAARAGANVDDVGEADGTALGMPGSAGSVPHTPVWPGASTDGIRDPRPFAAGGRDTHGGGAGGGRGSLAVGRDGHRGLRGSILERGAGHLGQPGGGGQHRPQRPVERDQQPGDEQQERHHERARRREQRLQDAHEEATDAAAGPVVERDELEQAEEARVGHRDAQERPAPRRAGLLAGPPLHVPARPAAGRTAAASARSRRTAPTGCATSRSGSPRRGAAGRSA